MALPTFIDAGSGVAITTPPGTVLKAGCKAGNIIVMQILKDGTTGNVTFSSFTNLESTRGTDNTITLIGIGTVGSPSTGIHDLRIGRAIADGTCSVDLGVDAGGDDLYARLYEFSGVQTFEVCLEGGAEISNAGLWTYSGGTTSTSITNSPIVTTNLHRLCCMFIAVDVDLSIPDFTGETGGDWTKPIAEYGSSVGTGGTICLQTAAISSAGTLSGGSSTISSAGWGTIEFALIPETLSDIPAVAWWRA